MYRLWTENESGHGQKGPHIFPSKTRADMGAQVSKTFGAPDIN